MPAASKRINEVRFILGGLLPHLSRGTCVPVGSKVLGHLSASRIVPEHEVCQSGETRTACNEMIIRYLRLVAEQVANWVKKIRVKPRKFYMVLRLAGC